MKYDPFKHHRRSIRLKDYDYTQAGAYFITCVTHNRDNLFGDIADGEICLNEMGHVVEEEWLNAARVRPNVELDEFVVMPNHFHGIIVISGDNVGASRRLAPTAAKPPRAPAPNSIGAIMAQFKSIVTKRINLLCDTQGAPVWQRNYYEHIIRNDADLDRIRAYIFNNPFNWQSDDENLQNLRRG